MKKYMIIFLVALILVTTVACQGQGKDPNPSKEPQPPVTTTPVTEAKSVQERLKSIVDASGIDGIMTGRKFRQMKKDDVAFMVGTESFNGKFKECVALEPEIDIDAFVLGLFEVEEGSDVKAFAEELSAKANLQKWVCVGAEAKYIAVSGPYVLFVMSSKADIAKIADAAGFEPISG